MTSRGTFVSLALASMCLVLTSWYATPRAAAATWLAKLSMPTPRGGIATAVVNNKVYAIGGVDGAGTTFYSTVEVYDPATDTWATVAPMPTARANLAATVVNGKIYAIGGGNPGALATVEVYDPAVNWWSGIAPMPTARSGLAAAAVNGKVYAIGGTTNGFDDFATVEQYDPATYSWSTKSPMPTPRFGLAAAVVNNVIYAVAGAQPFNPLQTLEAYDPSIDTWTTKASMTTVARYQLTAAAVGTTVYAIGGCYCPTLYSAVEAYDAGSNTWSPVPSLPTARSGLGAGVVNGVLYAIGGTTGYGVVGAVNEAYDTGFESFADHVFGQSGNFNSSACNGGGLSAASLCTPIGVARDGSGHLYIADAGNNRVLEYDSPLVANPVANRVIGQPGFASSACNNGGISANSLCNPLGIAVDASGRLYVADYSNNRVLEYDSPLTSQTATHVFGQPDFVSGGCNSPSISAITLCGPEGVKTDAVGRLYVADKLNHRVLGYGTPLASQVAGLVLGAPNFLTGGCSGLDSSHVCFPEDVAIDAAGNAYVSDYFNNRIVEFNAPLTNGEAASRVFGQGGVFTSNVCNNGGVSASSICTSSGLAVDNEGHLYSSDGATNNRALEWDSPLTNQTANRVFGQGGSFATNACNQGGISGSSLCGPNKVAVDTSGNFYVADPGNNRVLEYDNPTADADNDGLFEFWNPGAGQPCIQDHAGDMNNDGYSDSDESTPPGAPTCTGAYPQSGGLGLDPSAPCPGRNLLGAPAQVSGAKAAQVDFNLDGLVNGLDLNQLAKYFTQFWSSPTDFRAELNARKDGFVQGLDLNQLAKYFGQAVPAC